MSHISFRTTAVLLANGSCGAAATRCLFGNNVGAFRTTTVCGTRCLEHTFARINVIDARCLQGPTQGRPRVLVQGHAWAECGHVFPRFPFNARSPFAPETAPLLHERIAVSFRDPGRTLVVAVCRCTLSSTYVHTRARFRLNASFGTTYFSVKPLGRIALSDGMYARLCIDETKRPGEITAYPSMCTPLTALIPGPFSHTWDRKPIRRENYRKRCRVLLWFYEFWMH